MSDSVRAYSAEDRAAFEFALTQGRGLVELRLDEEQYAKLQNQKAFGIADSVAFSKRLIVRPN
jgi:hypothetical protein